MAIAEGHKEIEIKLALDIKPSHFVRSVREHGTCTISSASEEHVNGAWRLRVEGRRIEVPAHDPAEYDDISVSTYLSQDMPANGTWLSRNPTLEFTTRDHEGLTVTLPVQDSDNNNSVHMHEPSASERIVIGRMFDNLWACGRNRVTTFTCTVYVRRLQGQEAAPDGYTTSAHVVPVQYATGNGRQQLVTQRPSEPKNYLDLFVGEPFVYDSDHPFTDCRLIFMDKTYHCHRSVLAVGGRVFKTQLTSLMDSGDPNVFHVDLPEAGLTEDGVNVFVMAVYHPQSLLEIQDLGILVQAYHLLDYYGADAGLRLCTKRLGEMVSPETAKELLIFADNFSVQGLMEPCLETCAGFESSVWKEPQWVTFSTEYHGLMVQILERVAQGRERDMRDARSQLRASAPGPSGHRREPQMHLHAQGRPLTRSSYVFARPFQGFGGVAVQGPGPPRVADLDRMPMPARVQFQDGPPRPRPDPGPNNQPL